MSAKAKVKKNKLKTKRAAAKRFKKTAGGYTCRKSNRSHILTKKASKRKRQLRDDNLIDESDQKSVKRLLSGS